MTRLAFADAADGYYEVDLPEGEDLPEWVTSRSLAPCELRSPVVARTVRVVSLRQARLALLALGLEDEVDAAIAALPDAQRKAARIEWEYATEVRDDNPTVVALAAALNLDLDQLFELAEGIQ